MKHLRVFIVVLVLHVANLYQTEDENSAMRQISASNEKFARDLYGVLSNSTNTNVLFSPLSVHVIVSLACMEVRGETARDLAKKLSLPSNRTTIRTGFQQLLLHSHVTEELVTLEIASRIYMSEALHIRNDLANLSKTYFETDIERVNFTSLHCEGEMNKWVREKTHGQINNTISQGSVDRESKMILVTALHFKSTWFRSFRVENTITKPFFVSENKTRDVRMMQNIGFFKHQKVNRLGANMLVLPYDGKDKSLVIILPIKVDGLAEVEDRLWAINLNQIMSTITEHLVSISVPRFRVEQATALAEALKKLGLGEMFESNANFATVQERQPYVGQVFHKAQIEVGENGTLAPAIMEAVDELELEAEHESKQEGVFTADHPFMFLVHCAKSGAILFMGRFSEP